MNKPLLPYTKSEIKQYKSDLEAVASLSNLFSTSRAPLIYYRATENIYCHAFKAKNVARADATADAVFNKTGVGIKTFLENSPIQKIAEFNKLRTKYIDLAKDEAVKLIASFRNDRISFTKSLYGLDDLIYHCVVRNEDGFIKIFEEPMNSINIEKIRVVSETSNSIFFTDGIESYEFNFSKSTLFKKFNLSSPFIEFKVSILPNVMDFLHEFVSSVVSRGISESPIFDDPFIILPLYSEYKKLGKIVPPSSGINQWNGYRTVYKHKISDEGEHIKELVQRKRRNPYEVYIPFPARLRQKYPDFFPPAKTHFKMFLPNGKCLSMAICQQGGKALMSNPNSALGEWLLDDALKIRNDRTEPITYDFLERIGVDSVKIYKHKDGTYSIDFVNNSLEEDDIDDSY